MSCYCLDTLSGQTDIWTLRKKLGVSRERIVRQLEQPVTTKTLERWETGETQIPGWREAQLRTLYAQLAENGKVAAA